MPDTPRYYATTPIYYANGEPHIGHAYTTVLADVVSSYHRLLGDDTYFVTGTDEHGENIQKRAEQTGVSPQAFVDTMSQSFREAWQALGVHYDDFIRTTNSGHIALVQRILQQVYDNGDIVYGEYGGLYCVKCERFYTEKELDAEGRCPQHLIAPEERMEANYFFTMEKYRPWLQEYLESNPDFIRPSGYRNEVLGMLREPIGNLSISRPKSRIHWGIPLPWDSEHVTYVWFDALLNYYSALESKGLTERYWGAAEHFIGKDILKPHAVFWPTMLKAAGLPLYQHVNVHGYWLIDGGKMSKSQGNVVKPLALKDRYGLDAFRYFLARDMTFGLDASFSELALAERINADLANDLGNLLNRSLGMLSKYRDGVVPALQTEAQTSEDEALATSVGELATEIRSHLKSVRVDLLLVAVLDRVRAANKYVTDTAPWTLAKDPTQQARLDTVLYSCLETLRIVAVALSPVMPNKSRELLAQLGVDVPADATLSHALLKWGGLQAGSQTRKAEPLFPRIDLDALRALLEQQTREHPSSNEPKLKDNPMPNDHLNPSENPSASSPEQAEVSTSTPLHKPEVSIDDFARLEFRVAEVTACEHHPKADKLLVLSVALADETRTIVSGIRQWYSPEQLVGKKVVIAANLKPVKLRGILSQGMVLAAEDDDGNLSVVTLDKDVARGSEVR